MSISYNKTPQLNVQNYGAKGDGSTDDTVSIQSTINAASNGVVLFPPGTYLSGPLTVNNNNTTILGYGASLLNSRLIVPSGVSDTTIEGLTIIDDTSNASTYLMVLNGTRFRLNNVTLEKNPIAGGYQCYVNPDSSYGYFNNLRLFGSNGIHIAGHDHTFIGCQFESTMSHAVGGDDAYVIKAAQSPCYNISIVGGHTKGYQSIVSIGSEVGEAGVDSDYSHYVKNVNVNGVTAFNCKSIATIKPGALSADYRHGLVENINISDCTLEDSDGFLYGYGLRLWAGRGCIIRKVNMSNCLINARAHDQSSPNTGLEITVKNLGAAASIENVTVNGLQVYDVGGGSGSGAGYPIDWFSFIELENSGVGSIDNVLIQNCSINGSRIGGSYIGQNIGGVRFENPTFKNIAVNPPSSVAGGFYHTTSGTSIHGAQVNTLNYYPVSSTSLSAIGWKSEKVTVRLGSAAAGNTLTCPCWHTPSDCYIWRVELINAANITNDNSNYSNYEVRQYATGNTLVTANTTITSGITVLANTPVPLTPNAIVDTDAWVPANTLVRFNKTEVGSGAALTNAYLVIHYIPYTR